VSPKDHFDQVWLRCHGLSAMHAFMASQATAVLPVEEILRAEWVARVSALDLYVHELVCQRMLAAFEGTIPRTAQFQSFQLPLETVERIRNAPSPTSASAAFDLEVRRQLAFVTYQDPEKIADGVRMCSGVELWNAIAVHQGASQSTKVAQAKQLKNQLRAIVDRRNKIAHEGDMQPTVPASPWPIAQADLAQVAGFIEGLVMSIDACV
jgi:hypothetical protein